MTLDEIAIRHGCDASSVHHDYCRKLEPYLNEWRGRPTTALEIGVQFGLSAKTWLEYFTHEKTMLIGVDCVDNHFQTNDPRFGFILGDAGSGEFWKSAELPKTLDLVFDDGDHFAITQQIAFSFYGRVFIVEVFM